MKIHQPEYDHVFFGGAKRCVVQRPFQQITISPSRNHPGFWDVDRITIDGATAFRKPIRQDGLSYFLKQIDVPADASAWESMSDDESDYDCLDLQLARPCNVVYFLKAGPFIKIGFTGRMVQSRIDQLKTGCPYEIRLLATIDGDISTERTLHGRFAKHRANLEWFHAADEIMSFILGCANAT